MAKVYYIKCRDVGMDCEFETWGASVEEVVEGCADHGHAQHEMQSFRPDFYISIRRTITIVEEDAIERRA